LIEGKLAERPGVTQAVTIDELQHFIIARDLLKGYVKIGAWN